MCKSVNSRDLILKGKLFVPLGSWLFIHCGFSSLDSDAVFLGYPIVNVGRLVEQTSFEIVLRFLRNRVGCTGSLMPIWCGVALHLQMFAAVVAV